MPTSVFKVVFSAYLQGRMNVVGRAGALLLWPPRSRIQVDRGCSYLSLGLADTLLSDKAGPGPSLLDSSDPKRITNVSEGSYSMLQHVNNKQCGASFCKGDTVLQTIKTMDEGRIGQVILWKT